MLHYSFWKKLFVVCVVLLGIVFMLPNITPVPSFFPHKTLKLGLDLRGGAYLLLQVEEKSVMQDFYAGLFEIVRDKMREGRIGYRAVKITPNSLSLSLKKPQEVPRALNVTKNLLEGVGITQEGGKLIYTLSGAQKTRRLVQTVEQSIEIVRRRIDASGTQEPLIQRQGNTRIVVQLPGVKNPESIKKILGKTAKMSFYLVDDKADVDEAVQGTVPLGSFLAFKEDGTPIVLEKRVYLRGENLIDAQPSYSKNMPVVSFRFNSTGARKFGQLTTNSVGRRLAIVLDGKVISAPSINVPIVGGSGIIEGNFTIQSANELAILLRAGSLPAPLSIVEERTVGPGLGADSIRAGEVASVIGLVAIVVFMIFIYRRFGVYASVALFVNIILIVAILTALQATLTLPGIAGIVLTMGMAVDSNVLIFERIRERYNSGVKLYKAVDEGFSFAYTTIIDANITGLIAGLLLYAFGTGPIQGFAVTLSIGIVCSMFSAIMITKWLLYVWIARRRPRTLPL